MRPMAMLPMKNNYPFPKLKIATYFCKLKFNAFLKFGNFNVFFKNNNCNVFFVYKIFNEIKKFEFF